MALEIINAIKETENEARKIRQNAAARAKEIEKNAVENGEALVAEREKDARAEASKLAAKAEIRAAEIADSSAEDEAKEKARISALAQKNTDAASRFIIGELYKQ